MLKRAAGAVLAALLSPAVVQGQIPDTFKNLKVLRPDVPKAELVTTMRGFASGLGVRCTHCHVGPDNLQGMDFASDEKAEKRAAREMMRMAAAINTQFLTALPQGKERQSVECFTCHRGQPVPPRALHVVLLETVKKEGVPAALEQHRKLRSEHRETGVYNFSDRTLNRVGTALLEAQKLDDAAAVLAANLELFPDSVATLQTLGQVHLKKKDAPAAVRHLARALELEPGNAFLKKLLDEAKAAVPVP
jgi:tetratricopeptide (TPR) repeat protein